MSPATTSVFQLAAHVRIAPDQSTSPSIKEQFSGTWKLLTWEIEKPSGEVIDSPLGPDPVGWITFHPDGCMGVEIMRFRIARPFPLAMQWKPPRKKSNLDFWP